MGEERLSVTLRLRGDRVVKVAVASTRRPGGARLLVGRGLKAAVSLVGLVYSLCGRAQTVAALQAAEAAIGRPAPPGVAWRREVRVLCEALDQTLVRCLLDWPDALEDSPDLATLRSLRARVDALAEVAAPPGWEALGGGDAAGVAEARQGPDLATAGAALHQALREALFAGRPLPDGPDDLPAWIAALSGAADAAGSRVLAAVLGAALALEDRQATGHADPVPPLTDWSLEALAPVLTTADQGPPLWRGTPAETGAFARFADHPLVAGLGARRQPLAARLCARLLDLDRIAARLAHLTGEGTAAGAPVIATSPRPGVGLSALETARGLLLHRAEVDAAGRVVDWRIVAPTDWTLHPRGALIRGMEGWSARDPRLLRRRAALFVAAVDPCLAVDLSVEEAAHA